MSIQQKEKKLKTVNVFFDTEFTTIDPREQPFLISLGCVASVGGATKEFYVELQDTYHHGLCSRFVLETVLPLLEGGACKLMEAQVAVRLKEWVESLGIADEVEVIFRSDAPNYDWPFVADMLNFYGMWPSNMRRKCGVIGFDSPSQVHRYNAGLANYWKGKRHLQHHALVDAHSLLFAWRYAVRRGI